MSARGTTVPPITGAGLVLPDADPAPGRALSAAWNRFLAAACQRLLLLENDLPPELVVPSRPVLSLARQCLAREPRALMACLAAPAVGTPLQCVSLRHELEEFRPRIEAVTEALFPHLLLEMTLRRLVPPAQPVTWEVSAPSLSSLALGGELTPPHGTTGYRFEAGALVALAEGREKARVSLEAETFHRDLAANPAGFRWQQRYWKTGGLTHLALLDHNPLAQFEAHPDKAGNPIDLGGRPVEEWVTVLDECFDLIRTYLPAEHAEMAALLRQIIPVGYDEVKHLSASYREAVGTVYLTLHPNVMTMTEAVIHEFQHNKFNVSAYSSEYLTNAFFPLYKSPVRPDPRPLWGILLAVHAFLPVAELYRRMREAGHPWAESPEFTRRMSDIDLKNREGMEMLRGHGEFTEAGRRMFAELEALETAHFADREARGLSVTPVDVHLA